ncbi:conserved hypothetical protein [Trichinella spiralis]|uniref:hypothetical protein n=1 Tax=Trichinella spiralis TaxID=6334 RepID=UPI0001EFE451|nr:conserved hypothetical protein [Trichinella spiralis]
MNDERIVQQMYITYEATGWFACPTEKCMPTGHSSCIYFRKELGWIVLPNLPYSPPDTALTDYYLFWSLSSVVHCLQTLFIEFFESRLCDFNHQIIDKLAERWPDLVNNDENIILD